MAVASYAGVQIAYVHGTQIDDEPQYSDDGTEYLYTKRTVSFQGTLNTNLVPALLNELPAAILVRIRHTLETPRGQLILCHNTFADPSPLVYSPLAGQFTDAKNGPFPKRCNLKEIQGSECLLVDLSYETYVQECPGGISTYLSHRWRESVTIDENFYTIKTRTGKIVTRSDFYVNPDALRGIITPPIDNGFKREKSEYVLQEDGLALMYTFIDRERYVQPPAPATTAEGHYVESTADGGIRWAECRVKLTGSKYDYVGGKGALLTAAIAVVTARLELANILVSSPEGKWLAIGGIRQSLYENEVEVQFKTRIQPLKARTLGAAMDLRRFAAPPYGSDVVSGIPPDPGQRGTANLALIASVLNDPCLQQSTLRTGGVGPSTAVLTTGIPAPIIWLTTLLPDSTTLHSIADPYGVYSDYRINSISDGDPHIHMLATASPGAPAAFVQLAAATQRRVDEWRAERTGSWPKIPNPLKSDPNMVLLNAKINIRDVKVEGDGTSPRYILGGSYEYGFADPTKAVLSAGMPPYLDAGFAALLAPLPAASLVDGIIDPVPTTGGTNVLKTTPP
jgi:hypothetical protein